MTRPLPPALELQYPVCTLCGEEAEHDGEQFECPRCHATWPVTGIGAERGTWNDQEALQCGAFDGRFLPGGSYAHSTPRRELFRCMYVLGHEGEHRWSDGFGRHCWDDAHSATPAQIAAVRAS